MNPIIKKCSVCNSPIQSNEMEFCPVCNWELICIPGDASKWLIKYYSEKFEKYKSQYATNKAKDERLNNLSKEVDSLNDYILLTKEQLKEFPRLQSIDKEFIEYKATHPDSVIIPNGSHLKKEVITILWERISELNFRFQCDDIETVFPPKIVQLLKKDNLPQAYGDCDFSILVETAALKIISKTVLELCVTNKFIKAGSYYSKFMNLNYGVANIVFFHKEQTLGNPESFKSKTLITF